MPQVVITSAAFNSLLDAARARTNSDMVGALLGATGRDQAGKDFIVVTAALALGSTADGVAPLANAWNNLKARLDPRLHVVGWVAADAGLGIFALRIDEAQLHRALPSDTGLELAINPNNGVGGFYFLRNGAISPATSVVEALSGDEGGAGVVNWPGVEQLAPASLPAALASAISAAESATPATPVAETAPRRTPSATLPWPVAAEPDADSAPVAGPPAPVEPAPVQQPTTHATEAFNVDAMFAPRAQADAALTDNANQLAVPHVGLTDTELAQLWGPSGATGAPTRLDAPAAQLSQPVSASDADVYGRAPMTLATALADRRVLLGGAGVIVLLLLVFGAAILLGGSNTPPEVLPTPNGGLLGAGSTPTSTVSSLFDTPLPTVTTAPSSTPLTGASATQAPVIVATSTALPATASPTTASTPSATTAATTAATASATTSAATASVTTTTAASASVTTTAAASATSTTTAIAAVTGTPAAGAIISYTVKTGDTLISIAAAYNTTAAAIIARNNIANPDALHVGDVLSIKVGEGRAAATTTPRRTPTSTR